MKRAASPTVLTEVDEQSMVVEGVEEVILHEDKRLKTEAEEVCIDEGLVEEVVFHDQDGHIVAAGEVSYNNGVVYEEEIMEGEGGQLPAPQYQNLIIQHMDIAEPLSTLKTLLEQRLQCSLADHQFYLQDTLPLESSKSLVEQCVQGEGMVQVNLEVKSQPGVKPKINILDILKTADELEAQAVQEQAEQMQSVPATMSQKMMLPVTEETENVTRWIVDQNFRRDQERLKIPFDPMLWTEVHVKHWIQWAIKEFVLGGVNVNNFAINGQQLCALTHPQFVRYIPQDPGDIFWTHLELLRKCKFVAVMQQPAPTAITTITVSSDGDRVYSGGRVKTMSKHRPRSPRITGDERMSPGNRTGNNGQIQLWQFLLELLTDKECREVIQWLGEEGEFKLNNPELVAQMWGQRKNKPTMNYEKLSRALRYYYDGDMIAKVHGKRFVYKFVCDLKMLLGYSAGELNRQVTECVEKKLRESVRDSRRPLGILSSKHHIEQRTQIVQTMD